nr:hypothetical protein [uncultured Cohaesibacter sp.]
MLAVVFCLPLMLGGCPKSDKTLDPSLPVLPADLAMLCEDPGVKAGRDMRVELAIQRKFLALCRNRHRDTVAFYNQVRQLYAEVKSK